MFINEEQMSCKGFVFVVSQSGCLWCRNPECVHSECLLVRTVTSYRITAMLSHHICRRHNRVTKCNIAIHCSQYLWHHDAVSLHTYCKIIIDNGSPNLCIIGGKSSPKNTERQELLDPYLSVRVFFRMFLGLLLKNLPIIVLLSKAWVYSRCWS